MLVHSPSTGEEHTSHSELTEQHCRLTPPLMQPGACPRLMNYSQNRTNPSDSRAGYNRRYIFPEAGGDPEGYSEVSELNSYYLTTLDRTNLITEAGGGPEGSSEVSELNSHYLTTLD